MEAAVPVGMIEPATQANTRPEIAIGDGLATGLPGPQYGIMTPPPSRGGVETTATDLDELRVTRRDEASGKTNTPDNTAPNAPKALIAPGTSTTPAGHR